MPIYDLLNPAKYVDREHYRERLRMCGTCPERLEDENNKPLSRLSTCPYCGCLCSLKAKIDREDCPAGDWVETDAYHFSK